MSNAVNHTMQHLEDQQKQRLLKSKKPKEKEEKMLEKNPCKCSIEGSYDNFDGVEDELDLKLGIKFANLIETDDFKELQEAIRELRDENGRLNKLLGEKEEEIKIVRRRWKEDKRDLAGGSFGSDSIAAKIIEFSKKIRELSAELGTEKMKSQNLKRQLDSFEQQNNARVKISPTKEEKEKEISELAATKERLSHALLKSAEERNDMEALKKNLKIANKVLQREIGDNVSFQSLLNSSSSWRGRQQQILALQQKNNEFQQQLTNHERAASGKNASRNISNHGQSIHDEKNRLAMRKMELERKEQADKLQKELESVTQDRNALKEKNSATRARIKILTQDVKALKEKIATLQDKGNHDDELVNALLREQQYLKSENEKLTKAKRQEDTEQQGERVLRASGNFSVEGKEDNALVEKLKQEIFLQESKVKELEVELKDIKSVRRSQSHIPRPPGSAAGKRLDQRRPYSGSSVTTSDPVELQLQEAQSMSQAADVEKDKLNELVQVLQSRNSELVKEALQKTIHINECKHRNAKLEKQFEKLSLTQHGSQAVRARGVGGMSPPGKSAQGDVLELETRLNIQLENNDALKDALSNSLKSKEDDLKVFHQMVEQTKKIFLQGLRQYRATSAS